MSPESQIPAAPVPEVPTPELITEVPGFEREDFGESAAPTVETPELSEEAKAQFLQKQAQDQEMMQAAAEAARRTTYTERSQSVDPANLITIPDALKPVPTAQPVVEVPVIPAPPETPPQV